MATRNDRLRSTIEQVMARVHRRLIVLALVLSGATLMLSGLLTIRGYYERNLALAASTISYAVEPAIVFGDPDAIDEGLRSAGLNDVRLVELRDPQGRPIAQWPRSAGADAARRSLAERLLGIAPVTRQVRHGQDVIGEVHVFGNASALFIYLISGAVISLCCLGISALALRAMARRLQRDVVAPLADIAAVAHAVRRERAFDRRVPSSDIVEIDQFGQDFNALLSELEGWHISMTAEQDRLTHEATHDPLTGLGNRTLFDHRLEDLAAECDLTGATFALLYLDADHFKQVNDSHGHVAGDALLVSIADRLRGCIRQNDTAFRLGGDEFAVLLGPAIDPGGLNMIVSRIEHCMTEPVVFASGRSTVPSLSVGGATYPEDGGTVASLIDRADGRMYQHKLDKRRLRSAKG